jgi:hypothetical protein
MPQAGFEPAYALDRAATGIGNQLRHPMPRISNRYTVMLDGRK